MSVVGLDIGNLTCYICVAAGGGIDTVANEYSDRCTPSYVSLSQRNRSMGNSAKNQITTNLKNTVSGFKRLIGRKLEDPQVQDEIANYIKPYKIVGGKDGETLIQVDYMGETQYFTPEQIQTMLLTKLKETAEGAMKTKVVDVVISVPCFFTDIERRAMISSCQMAGLNCLKVMSDTTAVALAYGIYKQDLPAENEKARNVIFVDIGHCSLQAAAVSFNKGKLKILAVASDSNLGGQDFDKLIVDHFIQEWRTKYKIDVLTNVKAYIRLTNECERLKKLMSANATKLPANIECFMNDKDVTGYLDRATFEEMAAPLLKKAEVVFKQILEASKLSSADLYSVEVVGGSSRVPCIKNLVSEVFGKEPSTTLNADEAVAKGCALQCAILSPTFRVRDFSIQDCQPYPITLSWQPGALEDDSSLEIFPEFHQIPFSKMLTFYRKDKFQLEARYSFPNQVPILDTHIGSFMINKVVPQANGDSSKVKVKLRVNTHGIFTVHSASMIEKLEPAAEAPEEQGPDTMEVDSNKENSKDGSEKPADVATNNADGSASEQSMETDQTPATDSPKDEDMKENNDKSTEKSADKKDDKKTPDEKKKKKTTRSIDLPVESWVAEFTKEQLNLLIEKENQMIMQDRLEKERCDAKNAVEEYVYDMRDKLCGPLEDFSKEEDRENFNKFLGETEDRLEKERCDAKNAVEEYVYDMRDKLCGPLEDFSKEEDRENFNKFLGETEDWLYDEGEDQNKQVYIDKFKELAKCGDPIVYRYRESFDRPVAFAGLGSGLQSVRKFLDLYEAKDEKYDHLEKADVDTVKKCLKEKQEWFDKQMNAHSRLKKYENPTVMASQIRQTLQSLESTCSPIMTKPKPKPKEEPPKDEKKADAKEETKENQEKAPGDAASGDAAPSTEPAKEAKSEGMMDLD